LIAAIFPGQFPVDFTATFRLAGAQALPVEN
jgi:hypothetical protein